MTPPKISVERIDFRAAESAALPLLRNQQPVGTPEWLRGRRSEPAAYVVSCQETNVRVLATFRTRTPGLRHAAVKARRAGGDLGIGEIKRTELTFNDKGWSEPTPCAVQLRGDTGVGVETVEWVWQVEYQKLWREVDRTTHEIALVLSDPRDPWSGNQSCRPGTTPWWEVMRLACDAAVGARCPEEVLTSLTRTVFHVWGGRFYRWEASANYASGYQTTPFIFDCARFLRLLDGYDEPQVVDCGDTAAIIGTFASILGCDARQKPISVPDKTMHLLMVGHFEWRPPGPFGLHEVGVLDGKATVWDACLQLNTSPDATRPSTPLLPQQMAPDKYLSLLMQEHHTMQKLGKEPAVRSIGVLDEVQAAKPTDVFVQLAATSLMVPADLKSKMDTEPHIRQVDLAAVEMDGWRMTDTSRPRVSVDESSDREPVARGVWRRTADGLMVASKVYLCADAQTARYRALALLGRLLPFDPQPPAASVKRLGIHEIEYASAAGQVIVATYLNTAVNVRGASKVNVTPEIVRGFFDSIRAVLTPEAPPTP